MLGHLELHQPGLGDMLLVSDSPDATTQSKVFISALVGLLWHYIPLMKTLDWVKMHG